jgi:spermidine synthase
LKEGESLIDLVEGSNATLAVVRDRKGELSLRTNNHYGLGSAKNFRRQRLEAQIPMSLHPDPSSVFFLGLGTGITAGAALDFPLKKMTVCELMPEAVALSRKHFTPYVNGLFDDPRVRIVVEDGRTFLLGTADTYDVIVADLFLPYRAGVGSLYSEDHFAVVKSKLKPGGIFAQWLSIYQFSRKDLEIIERTMLSVFDSVTVWRADFDPYLPFVLFVCRNAPGPIKMDQIAERVRGAGIFTAYEKTLGPLTGREILTLYGGNLTASANAIGPGPLNTDNRPLIEFRSPVTIRNIFSGHVRAMNGDVLHDYFTALVSRTPPAQDPSLADATPADREMALAGLALFGSNVYQITEPARSQLLKESFFRRLERARDLRLEDRADEAS